MGELHIYKDLDPRDALGKFPRGPFTGSLTWFYNSLDSLGWGNGKGPMVDWDRSLD